MECYLNSDPEIQPLANTLHTTSFESDEEWVTDRGSEDEGDWPTIKEERRKKTEKI